MYVGHALVAFTLGAHGAERWSLRRPEILLVGAIAGGFALVPDVDTAYTAYVVAQVGPTAIFPTTANVWTAESWLVHRALTHSLLVGGATTGLVWLVAVASTRRRADRNLTHLVGLLVALVVMALIYLGFVSDGLPGIATMALYLGAAVGITVLAVRWALSPTAVAGAAGIGLLTHPFGDVFMGRPPIFLYPLQTTSTVDKVALATDPTVNLVGLFLLEVGLAWAAVWMIARVDDRSILPAIGPQALLGLGFGAAALIIRPPTLDVAYHFAIGTLSTGLVLGFGPRLAPPHRLRGTAFSSAVTALAAVTIALIAYLVAYLVL